MSRNISMEGTGRNPAAPRTRRRLAFACAMATTILTAAVASACPALIDTVPAERIRALSRGFNADGWINGSKSTPPSTALLAELRKAGMSHVRLPVPAERLMLKFASQEEREEALLMLDRALGRLTSLGYSVSVDLHPGDRFNRLHRQQPAAALRALKDAWTDLAHVIQHYPADRIFAELLNEPDVEADKWQGEVEDLASAVRQLLPQNTIIVGPVNWQRADSLPGFRPLADLNVVYAIHFYDPMAFTHQGHWDSNEPLHDILGLPFPIRADAPEVQGLRTELLDRKKTPALELLDRAIAASADGSGIGKWLEPAAAWQQRYSRPIIINEFGVLKAGAPPESRLRWLSSVVTYARQQCWGWTHWELAQGFGLVNDKTGKPDSRVMRALLEPARPDKPASGPTAR